MRVNGEPESETQRSRMKRFSDRKTSLKDVGEKTIKVCRRDMEIHVGVEGMLAAANHKC